MKPNPPEWDRLVAAARRAPYDQDMSAPYGFAARVAALSQSADRPGLAFVFQRVSLRAMGLAAALAVAAVAINFTSVRHLFDNQAAAPTQTADDPTSELVDLASS
ncbi:MAG TPA: hypothetical protein VGL42_18090 [Opitutaceae bacterium]|jgi:hypothetical protein